MERFSQPPGRGCTRRYESAAGLSAVIADVRLGRMGRPTSLDRRMASRTRTNESASVRQGVPTGVRQAPFALVSAGVVALLDPSPAL